MNRFIFAIPDLCDGCGLCLTACSDRHRQAGLQSHPRLALVKDGAPVLCHHCDMAPCKTVCPVMAISRSDDGGVFVNETACIGCRLCTVACPFGAITPAGTSITGVAGFDFQYPFQDNDAPGICGDPVLNWEKGVRSIAVKCDLCHFSPDGPACVAACPKHALFAVENDNHSSSMQARKSSKPSKSISEKP